MRTRRAAVVGMVAAGLTLAACSSSSSSDRTTTTTAAPATTRAPGGTTTTRPSAPGTTTTTGPGGPTQCPIADLGASIHGSSGAAGTLEVTIALTSSAATPCTLGGYPGLQLLGAGGADLPTTVVRKGSYRFTSMAPTVVSLTHGEAAYFNIGYSDVPTGNETSCPTSTALEVTPPNSYTSLTVAAQLAPCNDGTLVVSPVFSGTGPYASTMAPAPAG